MSQSMSAYFKQYSPLLQIVGEVNKFQFIGKLETL